MKILMITPYLPYPLVSGGQIRSYNLLKHLAMRHEITLVSFIRKPEEEESVKFLKSFCKDVKVVLRRKAWSPVNILLSGFTYFPFLISIYYSLHAKKIVADLLKKENFDLIHAETFYVMPIIPKTKIPVILVEQTVEFLVYAHFVEEFKFIPLKPLLSYDVFKIKFWEKHFWKEARKVIAMSKADKDVMKHEIPDLDVNIVPNGVDSENFSKIVRKNGRKPTVLFVGNFKWLQNREAVEFLVTKIWPEILANIKNARLWVVGRNPTDSIKNLAIKNQIIIDDKVDDIRDAYSDSDILLAPIFGPGGTRYKILEAMSSGLPVVTTSTGIEGVPAKNKREVLICDNPHELAYATIGLLKNQKLASNLSENAKKLVDRMFSWPSIADTLDKIYREVSIEKKN